MVVYIFDDKWILEGKRNPSTCVFRRIFVTKNPRTIQHSWRR
jgi:hypothetical protein